METKHITYGLLEAKKYNATIDRSPKWPKAEKEHLKLLPDYFACKPGLHSNKGLQVHHILPFKYCISLGRPDLELDQRNLITL